MYDYLEIGPTPCDEPCQQVGTPSYDPSLARRECQAFAKQLRRQFGEEPEGARIMVKANSHDFGTYHDVVVKFDASNNAAIAYAFKVEGECPAEWDETAKLELARPD